jgi:hypothetical protein
MIRFGAEGHSVLLGIIKTLVRVGQKENRIQTHKQREAFKTAIENLLDEMGQIFIINPTEYMFHVEQEIDNLLYKEKNEKSRS